MVYLFCLLLMTGCGGGNTPVSTLTETPLPKPIAPVTVSGSLATSLDASVDKTTLKVSTLNNSAALSSDGSFSAQINNQSYDFVTLSKDGTNPVALSVTVPGTTTVQLDAASTAKSLIFYTTFFSNPDGASIGKMVTEIASLQEVSQLAQELEPNMKKGLDISSSLTQTAKDLIKQATNKVLGKLAAAKEKTTNTCASPNSGFSLSVLDDSNVSQTKLQLTNTAQRHINVVVSCGDTKISEILMGPGSSLTGSSLGGLFDGSYKSVAETTADLTCGNGFVSAYGPGLKSSTQNRGLSYFEAFSRTFLSLSTAPISLMLTAMYGSSSMLELISKKGADIIGVLYKSIQAIMTAKNTVEKAKTDMPGAVYDLTLELATDEQTYKNIAQVLGTTISDKAAQDAAAKVNVAKAVWDIMMAVYNLNDLNEQVSCFVTPDLNKSPVISQLVATPNTIAFGGTSTLSVTASDPDGDTLTYQWSNSTGGGIITGTGSSVTFTAGQTEGTYTIYVTVSDGKGGSAKQDVYVYVTASTQNNPPSTPTGVAASAGNGQATISWSAASGATSYNLYMATESGVTKSNYSSKAGGMTHTSVTSPYTHASLTNGTTYYFVVTAVNAAGESAESSEVLATPSATANQAPTATLSSDKTSGTAPLTVTFTISATDSDGNICVDTNGKLLAYSLQTGERTVAGATTSPCTTGSSGSVTVSHTYNTAGTYTATATATDDKGASGTSGNVTITVSAGGGGTKTVKRLSAGNEYTCSVLSDASAKCWGINYYGMLGDGTTTWAKTPVTVSGLTTATAISAGEFNTCALTLSGGVKCWGQNLASNEKCNYGPCNKTPVDTSLTGGITAISVGGQICAITSSGGVKCWNAGNYGSTPVDVPGLNSGVTAISVGYNHGCALTFSGGVKCWGNNEMGQLGIGTSNGPEYCGTSSTYIDCSNTALDVTGLTTGVVEISVGGSKSCAVLASGEVKCWGSAGFNSESGTKTTCSRYSDYDEKYYNYDCYPSPALVSGLSGVKLIASGAQTCIVLSSGNVKCWGLNDVGQLGNGTTTTSMTPVDVIGLSDVAAVSVGDFHTCALLSSGILKCWGSNYSGQLGTGTVSSTTPVSVDSSLYTLSPLQHLKHIFLAFVDRVTHVFGDTLWN